MLLEVGVLGTPYPPTSGFRQISITDCSPVSLRELIAHCVGWQLSLSNDSLTTNLLEKNHLERYFRVIGI
jgi:hypothetical protein